jgi:hypothetical protein
LHARSRRFSRHYGRGFVRVPITPEVCTPPRRFAIEEVAPGFTPDEVAALTEMELTAATGTQ